MCQTYREARQTGCGCTRGHRGVVIAAGCVLGAAALQGAAQRIAVSGVYRGALEAASSALTAARTVGITAAALVVAVLLGLGAAAIRREARRMLTESRPRVDALEVHDEARRHPIAALPATSEVLGGGLGLPEPSRELVAARLHSP
jgi:uncharacterized membrane protein (UPF0136 family)